MRVPSSPSDPRGQTCGRAFGDTHCHHCGFDASVSNWLICSVETELGGELTRPSNNSWKCVGTSSVQGGCAGHWSPGHWSTGQAAPAAPARTHSHPPCLRPSASWPRVSAEASAWTHPTAIFCVYSNAKIQTKTRKAMKNTAPFCLQTWHPWRIHCLHAAARSILSTVPFKVRPIIFYGVSRSVCITYAILLTLPWMYRMPYA